MATVRDGLRRVLRRPSSALPGRRPTPGVTLGITTAIDQQGVRAALDGAVVSVVVLADVATLGTSSLRTVCERGLRRGWQVVLAVHDVHAGPATMHPAVTAPRGVTVASVGVHATVGGAIAAALPHLRGTRTLVVDASIDAPDGAWDVLLGALLDDTAVVQAVVSDTSDVVASAGAALPEPGALVAPLLAGHPREDVAALRDDRVFAADEPVLVAWTALLAPPPRTIDVPVTLADWTRRAASSSGRVVRFADVGRVYRSVPESPRRLDSDAEVVVRGWGQDTDDRTATTLASGGLRIAGTDAGPAGRPVALRVPQLRLERVVVRIADRPERLRWSIKTAAVPGPRGDDWGDTFFAADLATALRELGQDVVVDRRAAHVRPRSEHLDDVSLVLRGLDDTPVLSTALNVLWVISHPDLVTDAELGRFDLRFAAGAPWARTVTARTGLPVLPLHQATDPRRFHPEGTPDRPTDDVVFVGKTRQVVRPVVLDAIAAGLAPQVWGEGWRPLVPASSWRGSFIANDRLPELYRGARVVLNDHWGDMAREGFVSNRLFDAAAAGAAVITDDVPGLADLFGDAVVPYRDPEDMRSIAAVTPFDVVQRAERGRRIGAAHSFAQRAQTLVDAVVAERARRAGRAPERD